MVNISRRRATQALAALAAAPLWGCGEQPRAKVLALTGRTMAGTYGVKIARAGAMSAAAAAALGRDLFAAVDAVDRGMSTYRTDSELSRLNRHAVEVPLAVSPSLAEVLAAARQVSAASDGAFDVTVGALVDAWGFGPTQDRRRPAADEIARLRDQVGWKSLVLDPAAGTVTKTGLAVYADLSGIAQGYGADRIAAALEARGFGDYLVEVSGEVRARGVNGDGVPWRIGIERPDGTGERRSHYIVPLANLSLATSGDYRNYFELGGRRYSHEIDPETGEPVAHRLASVTAVHPVCALADAWATALFVLGPARGRDLAVAQGLPAYFISRAADGTLVGSPTPAFVALGGRAVGRG
jgi:FAD:protein FMN transferase